MIWSLDTVGRVSRCWQALKFEDLDMYYPEATSEYLHHEFSNYVLSELNVEVHPDDCVVTQTMDELPYGQVSSRITWAPKTLIAELHGGPAEGKIVQVQSLNMIYKVVEHNVGLRKVYDDRPYIRKIEYHLSGWNPTTRQWVFTVKEN